MATGYLSRRAAQSRPLERRSAGIGTSSVLKDFLAMVPAAGLGIERGARWALH
jgi:hypothetical protein